MNTAPWKDFKGNDTQEGSTIKHPVSGQTGVIASIPVRRDHLTGGRTPVPICSARTIVMPKLAKSECAWLEILELKIGARTTNVLLSFGIHTRKQLLDLTAGEILKLPNIGKKSLEEIIKALAKRKAKNET